MSEYIKNPGNCYSHMACPCYHAEIVRLKKELQFKTRTIREANSLIGEAKRDIRAIRTLMKSSAASVAAAEKKKVSRPRRARSSRAQSRAKE